MYLEKLNIECLEEKLLTVCIHAKSFLTFRHI